MTMRDVMRASAAASSRRAEPADLVINIGAPKGASRLIQRVGRANHRLDEPSRALLVPSNRFEVLECRAALEAARDGAQDAVQSRTGSLDVLALSPLSLESAATAKILAHWLTTGLPLVVLSPVLGLLLNLPAPGYGALVASLIIGTSQPGR